MFRKISAKLKRSGDRDGGKDLRHSGVQGAAVPYTQPQGEVQDGEDSIGEINVYYQQAWIDLHKVGFRFYRALSYKRFGVPF
jgi:hypothetical protein